jgi:formate dehydrogenase major subunit
LPTPAPIDLVRQPARALGWTTDLPLARMFVLARQMRIADGADEVHKAFVAERCEPGPFQKWRAFVSLPKNSPETMAEVTGVPAALVRGAARLYARGGNGAIYYGLGVTEHSQGSTMVLGIANLAMATGNLGREGVGVNRCAAEQRAGILRHGVVPARADRLPPHLGRGHAGLVRQDLGVTLEPEPGLRIPNMFEPRSTAASRRSTCRARTWRSPIRTRTRDGGPLRARMPRGAGHFPQRDG